ncbi:GH36-type glycosyl hydrolase domain-containing protein [Paenibacillus gansuensis]|uniref:GH36-type glycosyl hydrolase domain-containing protein n=1 Tax=Paenibacillus gansuensis TaxID=306542 RepID=A0ABW5PK63_9BACL
MIQATETKLQLQAGELQFTFSPNGDLLEASAGEILINQLAGNPVDGSLNNLYLRLHTGTGITAVPLLGAASASRVSAGETALRFDGETGGVEYSVIFHLTAAGIWFWDIRLTGTNCNADILYGQDLGIGHRGFVRSNEAYVSQYIDHAVFETGELGYIVCSRQNQPQGGRFPYVQQGSLTKASGYSTDGFQFFGLSYKVTDTPEILNKPALANEVYQYEFAYTALQSELVDLNGTARFVFYGLYRPDHADAVTKPDFQEDVAEAWRRVCARPADILRFQHVGQPKPSPLAGPPLQSLPFSGEELKEHFPARKQEEWENGMLLSFFTETHEHVVLQEKEVRTERPHGHILMTGRNASMKPDVLATTSYMYGMFNSQVVVGNTSFNKMISNARSALNLMKTSGQRIYLEHQGRYRLLTMPSAFEMGFHYARWFYKTEDDLITVTNYTRFDTPEIRLEVLSQSGRAYRYLVTQQVVMNGNEYETPFRMQESGGILTFKADEAAMSASIQPELSYRMKVDGAAVTVSDESVLAGHAAPGSASLVVLELAAASSWSLTIQGLLEGGTPAFSHLSFEEESVKFREFYRDVMNGFRLSAGEGQQKLGAEMFKMNTLAWWYTHNMLVHYSSPHGLEQYGGAAWGTRDVCQGPAEYFLATQRYGSVREIIAAVYSAQYEDTGNWPQWFMFDRYKKIQSEESHGDIIVWPLKVIGDYLAATADYGILQEPLPYTDRHTFEFTGRRPALLEHIHKQLDYIRGHFLHDTHLSAYGDGDWDDTLQPANAQLKQFMASSWTVALTYQTIAKLSKVLAGVDIPLSGELAELAARIEADFRRYMLSDEVIPGFVYMEEPGMAERMLHPTDRKTGIQYRLLPMTRSMIGELLSPEEAEAHYQLIQQELFCPDGVRLMNRPAHYAGGVSINFKRAEQASNFGREIGLQYVHAHIRYVEAMAKLGKRGEVWSGLARINPIGLQEVVPNAELRQSNAYFSSSDGKFKSRYEAQQQFSGLRDGSVLVKGGWRIYSSGPGIYMNQLISQALGIRMEGGDLLLDPVLPDHLDGMRFEYRVHGKPVTFVYWVTQSPGSIARVTLNGRPAEASAEANRYRSAGVRISRAWLEENLTDDINIMDIHG